MPVMDTSGKNPEVSVIIPARNEEASLGVCLESLVAQSGVDFEIIVVNDHSTDRTGEIAASFANVRVIEARPLPQGWTGKNNAVACGAREARGEWLLFTDADTVHLAGSLARALAEATENKVEMLSYSPEQIAVTFWEMAILPVVFAELARQYPPSKVSDPASPIAAANGQFILIRRETYDAIGGHAAVASDILEDVALARRVKADGQKIRFRYAADAVRTRMYRNFEQLREGWTKNLALLFPRPGRLALETVFFWGVPWLVLLSPIVLPRLVNLWWWSMIAVMGFARNTVRLQRANFDLAMEFLGACFGMPMFAYLLIRSKRMHRKGSVAWKGRSCGSSDLNVKESTPHQRHKLLMKTPPILILLLLLIIPSTRLPLRAQITEEPTFLNMMIEPGHSLGPLKLGDSLERAQELFPKKDIDQEWEDACGLTIDWTDSANPVGHGEVFIRLKKGKVFQIESSTTRFHTAEDITTFDSPEKVEKSYKEMKAWVLLTPPSPALGSRPPVFWIDKKKGIAFELAYDAPHHKRYVYKVIVFEPNKMFCPEQETINSLKWQAIDAYRVEPPKELSPEP
jgi:glycosyltransferase involved in cell wall biosynthesis